MWTSKDQVDRASNELIGRTIGDILTSQIDVKNKGSIGTLIEKEYFNLTIGNAAAPDFHNLGMELKIVPVIKRKSDGKFKAKERVSLSMINYNEIINETFDTSKFKYKNENIQFIWYHHDVNKPWKKWKIVAAKQFNIIDFKENQAKQDWEEIQDKVINGYAHDLSEGDTVYIGAVTKGRNSKDVRSQPNSDIPAKRRGFSIKNKYVTELLDNAIGAYHDNDDLVKVVDYIEGKLNRIKGKDLTNIANILNIKKTAKDWVSKVVRGYLDLNKFDKEEMKSSNTLVRIRKNNPKGLAQEHIKMGRVSLDDISKDDWEDSQIRAELENLTIVDVRYNQRDIITNINIISFDELALRRVEVDYKTIRVALNNDFKVFKTNRGKSSNLPKISDSDIIHLRPSAKDGNDTYEFNGYHITKQAWWIHRKIFE